MRAFFLCRICLVEDTNNGPMQPLFEKNPRCTEILQQIQDCGGIVLREQQDLPQSICYQCLEALQVSHKFRLLCQASEKALQATIISDGNKIENDTDDDFFANQLEFIDAKQTDKLENDIAWSFPKKKNLSNKSLDKHRLAVVPKGKRRSKSNKLREQLISPPKKSAKRAEQSEEHAAIMCELCGNVYSQKRLLNAHMLWHREEKQVICEICNKEMSSASAMARHIRTHTGEKPFVCKFCGRKFSDRSSIIRHERIHTNERPYCCQTCGKCFSYSNSLTTHMLTHTGEKRFNCLPCKKSFACKHQQKQHYATLKHQKTIKNEHTTEKDSTNAIKLEKASTNAAKKEKLTEGAIKTEKVI